MSEGAKIAIYEHSLSEGPLRQGEILSDLIQARLDPSTIDVANPIVDKITHPIAIILSQDCDLDWDFKARKGENSLQQSKILPNVLFCEVGTAMDLRGRADIKSDIWSRIKINKDERYHFLQRIEPDEDAVGEGLPELGIDFKRYFTIPTDEVYLRLSFGKMRRRCRLVSPYLEHFSARFAYYQARVALPEEHFSEPVKS